VVHSLMGNVNVAVGDNSGARCHGHGVVRVYLVGLRARRSESQGRRVLCFFDMISMSSYISHL
jgi:hypothetical protein